MEDFAGLLLSARERAGMTQAQVAVAAGLTPSYLSFIENRKKPPPSDEVCRRLAAVLDLAPKKLIEVAHLERAPETVRKRVRSLRHTLKRERRSRRRLLESLLSPFLFAGPPGYVESALDTLGISQRRQKRIREALAAVGREHQDQADEVARLVEDLPERDRARLLDALPRLLQERGPKSRKRAPAPTTPPMLYSPPDRDAMPAGPYLLEWSPPHDSAFPDEIRAGDVLLVDTQAIPQSGDLILLRGEEGALVRRLEAVEGQYRLAGGPDAAPDLLRPDELEARLARVGLGTVLEIRRPLRRRRSR